MPDPASPGPHLLLFDGACGLCQRTVRLVRARDRSGRFRLEPLQGEAGRAALVALGRDPEALDSVVVVADPEGPAPAALDRARAVLFVAAALGPPWSWLGWLGRLPDRWLDRGYDLVARHRRRLGGAASCPAPPRATSRAR